MIKHITIKNFIGFKELSIPTTNLNIVIGENDTGKTGFLKLLYGVTKSLEEYSLRSKHQTPAFSKVLGDKLRDTFQPAKSGLGELVSKGTKEKLHIDVTYSADKYKQNIKFSFGESTVSSITDSTSSENIKPFPDSINTLFIPAKEVLTAFDAIAATREKLFMLGFDDTYQDLIKSLRLKTRQGNIPKGLNQVNEELERLFDGIISFSDKENRFVFSKGKEQYSMPLTAEGIKKIGILTTLIRNRQVNKGTILFMDEPETALHPKATRSLAEMVFAISQAGVQVFLSTHSYFLIKQLSIIARREQTEINCFSFTRNKGNGISSAVSDLKKGMPENPIIQEALAMFDEETDLDLASFK